MKRQVVGRVAAGLLAVFFGVMTVVEGGSVLFGGPDARVAAGAVVPFVLWFNFSAAFVYVATGALALADRGVALSLARLLAAANLIVFAALGIHIATGGAFEPRTVVAMTIRSAFWIALALALPHLLSSRADSTARQTVGLPVTP